ncbi:MAG: methylated-DNA--[protein]-cysteine S-methyltransferase [Candidatus Competibacter sp.]|nr:methylated-DNA--[protein]-cysteine S-methyltransferase [Candidatus Competibacter sp.]MDG4582696.1 methylated-DNA--[protein]-cysteine S-methyltransferase [Candidatus Competibacter sp.]
MIATEAYRAVIATPLGRIGIRMVDEAVSELDYLPVDAPELPPADAATQTVVAQLQAYFHDSRTPFTVALAFGGTAFQQRAWKALRTIPPGTVLTYGELAARLGTAARAIGGACRSNPIPIFIPCHRVVARQGLGGYAGAVSGDSLGIKRWLLRHEGVDGLVA